MCLFSNGGIEAYITHSRVSIIHTLSVYLMTKPLGIRTIFENDPLQNVPITRPRI